MVTRMFCGLQHSNQFSGVLMHFPYLITVLNPLLSMWTNSSCKLMVLEMLNLWYSFKTWLDWIVWLRFFKTATSWSSFVILHSATKAFILGQVGKNAYFREINNFARTHEFVISIGNLWICSLNDEILKNLINI